MLKHYTNQLAVCKGYFDGNKWPVMKLVDESGLAQFRGDGVVNEMFMLGYFCHGGYWHKVEKLR